MAPRLTVAVFCLAVVLAGCLASDRGRPNAQTCDMDSDCLDGQVCVFGLCRAVCAFDRDCPEGQVCVPDASRQWDSRVCTVGDEGSGQDCPPGTSSASGQPCRELCDAENPCGPGRSCEGGTCVESLPEGTVTAGEDCEEAPAVDLTGAPMGTTVDVWVDTRGRRSDYGVSRCDGFPDVLVRLDGLPLAMLSFSADCDGDLGVGMSSDDVPLCPPSAEGGEAYGGSSPCTSAPMFVVSNDPDTQHVLFCRDPADGPALAHITLQ